MKSLDELREDVSELERIAKFYGGDEPEHHCGDTSSAADLADARLAFVSEQLRQAKEVLVGATSEIVVLCALVETGTSEATKITTCLRSMEMRLQGRIFHIWREVPPLKGEVSELSSGEEVARAKAEEKFRRMMLEQAWAGSLGRKLYSKQTMLRALGALLGMTLEELLAKGPTDELAAGGAGGAGVESEVERRGE